MKAQLPAQRVEFCLKIGKNGINADEVCIPPHRVEFARRGSERMAVEYPCRPR